MELMIFDVADEMKTRILLENKIGDQVFKRILDCFNTLPDYSTLLIDITGADVIDYNFCSRAIGPLMKSLHEGKFENKYVIVKNDPEQELNLLEGILLFICQKKSGKNSKESFIDNNLSIKLLNARTNELEFIGKLSELQINILDLINEEKEVTSNNIANKINKSVEETIKILDTIIDQFFIYKKIEETTELYCSFFNLLIEGE